MTRFFSKYYAHTLFDLIPIKYIFTKILLVFTDIFTYYDTAFDTIGDTVLIFFLPDYAVFRINHLQIKSLSFIR